MENSIQIIKQALNVANKNGSFTLEESALIQNSLNILESSIHNVLSSKESVVQENKED